MKPKVWKLFLTSPLSKPSGVIVMTINDGDFIKISYTGRLEDGTVFDTTKEEVAKIHNIYNENGRYGGDVIIVSAQQTLLGFEEDIKKHDAGYEGTVSIPPEKGFGDRNPKLIKDMPIRRFEQQLQKGMQVQIDGHVGKVILVKSRHARVDFNTPMAGQTVTYEYKIDAVLEDLHEKAVGISTLYTGKEMDITIDGTVAYVKVPIDFNYFSQWTNSKLQMAKDLLKFTELTEIQYIETYSEDFFNAIAKESAESEMEKSEPVEPLSM